jgi:hypothetical protein
MRLNTKEWDRVFPQYLKRTRRDFATVLNTKGFYIARRATVETPAASKSEIQALTEPRQKTVFNKRGKPRRIKTTAAALIVNARLAKAGKPTLKNAEARKEGTRMVKARLRSRAFLKSGWLPSIKKLEPLADRRGIPRMDKSGQQIGRPKGFAVPAQEGWKPSCRIQNDALPKGRTMLKRLFGNDKTGAMKVAGPALQRAFDYEVRSMKDYLARKLEESAKRQGIRTA